MSAFDEFIMSDAFFPVIIVLLVLLIAVFIIITINNKRKYGPFRNIKNVATPEIDYSSEVHIVNDLSPAEEINDEEFSDILNTVALPKENNEAIKDESIDSNIVNESQPIETKPIENELKDLNTFNDMAWNAFTDISNEELSKNDVPENEEKVDIPNMADVKILDENKFMEDVHDFPDFSAIEKTETKETHQNSRIEEDVIDAANKYIESIMSSNK